MEQQGPPRRIGAQVVPTALAIPLSGRKVAIPGRLLSVARLVSVVSGFFDGGLGDDELTPALSAYQVFLLAVTGTVGVPAAGKAWRSGRGA